MSASSRKEAEARTLLEEEKRRLRRELLALRRGVPPERRRCLDGALRGAILSSPAFLASDCVLLYAPVDFEIDVLSVAEAALSLRKAVLFPLTEGNGQMNFCRVRGLSELSCGRFSIKEPLGCPRFEDFTERSLCLVPALAFTERGERLGRGGGYYDRFLSRFPGVAAGVVYREFLLPSLPVSAHDVSVSHLASEDGVLPVLQ